MIRSVVTGAAGFVGSHLAERLLSLGHQVIGIDNLSTGKMENINSFIDLPEFSFHRSDIRDRSSMSEILEKAAPIDYFFHLAAVVSVPFSVENPGITEETNYDATVWLLSKCEGLNVRAFIHAGSAAEYGDEPRLPIKEEYATDETKHLSPYGKTKYLASKSVAKSKKPSGISLRFFNIYGPRQDPSSQYSGVISRFIEQALRGEPLTVFGDGEQTRDFIYIGDVINVYLVAAGINPDTGQITSPYQGTYNVGRSKSITINRLAEVIRSIVNPNLSIVHLDPRPGDIRHSLADISKAKSTFGWEPAWGIEEGLKETIKWYQEQN